MGSRSAACIAGRTPEIIPTKKHKITELNIHSQGIKKLAPINCAIKFPINTPKNIPNTPPN